MIGFPAELDKVRWPGGWKSLEARRRLYQQLSTVAHLHLQDPSVLKGCKWQLISCSSFSTLRGGREGKCLWNSRQTLIPCFDEWSRPVSNMKVNQKSQSNWTQMTSKSNIRHWADCMDVIVVPISRNELTTQQRDNGRFSMNFRNIGLIIKWVNWLTSANRSRLAHVLWHSRNDDLQPCLSSSPCVFLML